ncbi:MAG: hypothetical protein ABIJ34_08080 [archaeon]
MLLPRHTTIHAITQPLNDIPVGIPVMPLSEPLKSMQYACIANYKPAYLAQFLAFLGEQRDAYGVIDFVVGSPERGLLPADQKASDLGLWVLFDEPKAKHLVASPLSEPKLDHDDYVMLEHMMRIGYERHTCIKT